MDVKNKDMKEIKGPRKLILNTYSAWERLYYRLAKVQADNKQEMLYIRPIIYKGPTIWLDDGVTIEKGDPVLQLHFNNRLLLETALQSKNTMHMITTMLKMLKTTFHHLSETVARPEYAHYKGLYGISLMHRGATQFGFSVIDLPKGFGRSYQQFYLRMLMGIMHPNGRKRLRQKTELLSPKIVAVSRQRFLEYAGKKTSEPLPKSNPPIN